MLTPRDAGETFLPIIVVARCAGAAQIRFLGACDGENAVTGRCERDAMKKCQHVVLHHEAGWAIRHGMMQHEPEQGAPLRLPQLDEPAARQRRRLQVEGLRRDGVHPLLRFRTVQAFRKAEAGGEAFRPGLHHAPAEAAVRLRVKFRSQGRVPLEQRGPGGLPLRKPGDGALDAQQTRDMGSARRHAEFRGDPEILLAECGLSGKLVCSGLIRRLLPFPSPRGEVRNGEGGQNHLRCDGEPRCKQLLTYGDGQQAGAADGIEVIMPQHRLDSDDVLPSAGDHTFRAFRGQLRGLCCAGPCASALRNRNQ